MYTICCVGVLFHGMINVNYFERVGERELGVNLRLPFLLFFLGCAFSLFRENISRALGSIPATHTTHMYPAASL